ncbi:nuclease [Endomicrobiia bacterium]|nr:nuclease [Endomicrobiia bacterium]
MEKQYYVYVITNKPRGTLYIGVTSNIARRIYEHKNKMIDGFSKKYSLYKLVYCESCNDVNAAIKREKMLKKWNRIWKIELIEKINPNWNDLYKNGFPLWRE